LAIYNRTGRHDEIVSTIADLLTNNRDILDDPDFLERLTNDTDLIGVGEIVTRLREKTP
jgi:hypothetical protein